MTYFYIFLDYSFLKQHRYSLKIIFDSLKTKIDLSCPMVNIKKELDFPNRVSPIKFIHTNLVTTTYV